MVALPFCNLEIVASKPKPDGYPEKVETLGEHLRARRMDLGLLQKDVAKILNVSTCSIENWENHRTYPAKSQHTDVLDFLGTVHSFVSEEERIGKLVSEYRVSNGLSQKQIATEIGIGLNTYRKLERNEGHALLSIIKKVQSFLNSN